MLIKHLSLSFGLRITSAILAFVALMVIARLLGPEGVGIYALVLSFTQIAAMASRLGIDTILMRDVARDKDRPELVSLRYQSVDIIYKKSVCLVICLGIFVAFLCDVIYEIEGLGVLMSIMMLSVAPIAFMYLNTETLKGLKKTSSAILISEVLPYCFLILGLFLLVPVIGIFATSICFLIAYFAAYVVSKYAIVKSYFRNYGSLNQVKGDSLYGWPFIKEGFPVLLVNILELMLLAIGPFLLAYYFSESEVGAFRVAARIAMLTSFVMFAVNAVGAPRFSRIYKLSNRDELEKSAAQISILACAMAAPIFFIFIVFPEVLMSVFGDFFAKASSVLVIIAIGQLFYVLGGPVAPLLLMTGNAVALRNIYLVTFVVCIFTNAVLVPQMGLIGAAVAIMISRVIQTFLSYWAVKRQLEINPFSGVLNISKDVLSGRVSVKNALRENNI